ncbi:MAG: protoheme IX farnesyltransferase [Anaerolineae bacterium]
MSKAASLTATGPRLGAVIVALFKLRIVALLLLAALAGAFLAAAGRPGWRDLLVLILTGAAAAAGASALNEYFERERDAQMRRTALRRLLTTGAIGNPRVALIAGLVLMAVAVLAALLFNSVLAFFLFAGAFIYAGIYTLWLKPRTPLNIGGLAGSCAVLSGSAAVGRWDDPAALLLALALFFWTPIHFWSLALVFREDYARVNIPMLPAVVAPRTAAVWGLAHGVAAGARAAVGAAGRAGPPLPDPGRGRHFAAARPRDQAGGRARRPARLAALPHLEPVPVGRLAGGLRGRGAATATVRRDR